MGVRDFFECNGTAYIVMDYLDGINLSKYIRKNGKMPAQKVFELMLPIMSSLENVHNAGIIHRDISPDNIMYMKNGTLKLMDFGSARYFVNGEKEMSVMLKRGYAPEEQYRKKGVQGPWTDVYGLCATIYRCITGVVPEDALDRLAEDEIKKPSELGIEISQELEDALMMGLAVRKENRCQNMVMLKQMIKKALDAPGKSEVSDPQQTKAYVINSKKQDEVKPYVTPAVKEAPKETKPKNVSSYDKEPPQVTQTQGFFDECQTQRADKTYSDSFNTYAEAPVSYEKKVDIKPFKDNKAAAKDVAKAKKSGSFISDDTYWYEDESYISDENSDRDKKINPFHIWLGALAVVCVIILMVGMVFASTDTYKSDVYIVAGDEALCGSYWDPSDTNNQMIWNEDTGVYEKNYYHIPMGIYEFRIVSSDDDGVIGESDLDTNQQVDVLYDDATVYIWTNETDVYVDIEYPEY